METLNVFVLVLASLVIAAAPAQSQMISASENPIEVGHNVTLINPEKVVTGAWMFNNSIVIMIFGDTFSPQNVWKDRILYDTKTSSLTVMSLTVEDSGNWTLQALNVFRASLHLSVQAAISNVTLAAQEADLVEFNDTAVLRCSVSSGSHLVYSWLNGSSAVTPDERIRFSDGGSVLNVDRVTRHDQGPFRCNVSNGISQGISSSVQLSISYGPSSTMVTVTPEDYAYITGSNITLRCSADSSPPAEFRWLFNGEYLDQADSSLQLQDVAVSNAGDYKCLSHNTVTSRFSSETVAIKIIAPIASVVVNHAGGPPIDGEMFTLHCNVTGTFDRIQWLRNGALLSAGNTTMFGMSNKTLTLHPVWRSDEGDYQCQAFNYVSNKTSEPYTVHVNYGPMTPSISGESRALTGTEVTLGCRSDSVPQSHFKWYFGDTLLANTTNVTVGPLTLHMSGDYVCMAFNNVTGRNSSASHMLSVYAPVTMVSVNIAAAQPVLNQTFTLRCEGEGNVTSIIWQHAGYPLSADHRRHLSADNTTLTFDPVMLSDNGNYSCEASNPLSNMSSDNFMLDVFYGPETPTIMGPTSVKMGHNVTLTCNAPSNPPSTYIWIYNDTQADNTPEYVTPPLTKETNMFTCMAYNNITSRNTTAHATIVAIAPITDVQVEMSTDDPTEGRSYQLSCATTGPVDHIYWMRDDELLREDNRTVFHMWNKTVAIDPLERSDSGSYRCFASNAFWNRTSEASPLQVNFGPDMPVVQGSRVAEIGQTVNFSCSAVSVPPSQLSWYFNNTVVSNTSVFTGEVSSLEMGGEYTCMAYNNVTESNSSASLLLHVREATVVRVMNDTVPIDSRYFRLICEVVGPYDRIYWMKDNVSLDMNNMTAGSNGSYYMGNDTLHFSPVTRMDDGSYQCVADNDAGAHASPAYMLQVNYGPLSVTIVGPDSVPEASLVTLTCTADSRPHCDYQWFFDNPALVLHHGQSLIFPAFRLNEGKYKCVAMNPVTGISMTQTKTITISHASALHSPSLGRLMLLGVFALSVSVLFS